MLRHDFLRLGALPLLGAVERKTAGANCILLMMVGGPSQLDTFDMKPDAPSDVRGPFRPIRTNVPGISISEIFPRTARHADKFSLIRSMHHDGPAVHDAGHHLMQTGRLFSYDVEHPSVGCVASQFHGVQSALLPSPIGATGGNMPHGDGPGFLGERFGPAVMDCEQAPERYGRNRFGRSCFQALRLVESGVRFVTVNMFETVFDELTWDIHGAKPFTPISAYRDVVGPMFDMAYSSLLADLSTRGLLSNTMVVAMGEFGRTPRINASGGRDHWTQCYTVLAGGGPLRGGTVIGSSDAIGAEPKDRPVHPGELAATIYKGLGIPLGTELRPGLAVVEAGVQPIGEHFALMCRCSMSFSVLAGQGFERDLQPIFRKHCYGCHAATVKMGSLDIETHEGVMRGGNQGPIVMPGKAAESRLYLTLTGAMEPFMPMGGQRLGTAELEVVKRWIDAGARPDPGGLVWKGGVIAVGWGGEIWVLHEKGKLMRKISARVGTVRGVWLSEDGRMVGAAGDGVERVYEALTGIEVKVKGMAFQTGREAVSPDGRRRAVLAEDGSVRIHEQQ